jgi:hypothetical protein
MIKPTRKHDIRLTQNGTHRNRNTKNSRKENLGPTEEEARILQNAE